MERQLIIHIFNMKCLKSLSAALVALPLLLEQFLAQNQLRSQPHLVKMGWINVWLMRKGSYETDRAKPKLTLLQQTSRLIPMSILNTSTTLC